MSSEPLELAGRARVVRLLAIARAAAAVIGTLAAAGLAIGVLMRALGTWIS